MNPAPAVVTDSLIAEAAANALSWQRVVAPETVNVAVTGGWLTLTGVVADLHQRGAAERAVRGLRGVRGVSNALAVIQAAVVTPRLEDRRRQDPDRFQRLG